MTQIVDTLRGVDGADTRVVAHLDAIDFTVEFIREDLESEYTDRDLDEAYQLLMANQVTGDDFKDLIGEEFRAQTLFFEEIVVLILPSARYEAVFASFDRRDPFPVTDLVEAATDERV
jgi:hypothetical protein